MFERNMRERFGIEYFFAAYIMSEMRKAPQRRTFGAYLDVWPDNYEEFPLFFNKKELDYLEGSPYKDEFNITNELIKEHYGQICREIPEFARFDSEEFSKVLTIVYSRVFTVQVPRRSQQTCLVPFADMINHSSPMKVNYYYDDEEEGMVFEAM